MNYDDFRHVLLLGEADFSFALAFSKEIAEANNHRRTTITATEYGDGADIGERYFGGDDIQMRKFMTSFASSWEDANIAIVAGLDARALGDSQCPCQTWNNEDESAWVSCSNFWDTTIKPFDLVIFNFPHSTKHGKASKLVRAFFKQVRKCMDQGRISVNAVVEMRLRTLPESRRVRAIYKHEESATESGFELIGSYPCDLHRWKKRGYEHKMTRRNETCLDITCNVWRWSRSRRLCEPTC